jgi:hypothetical protein
MLEDNVREESNLCHGMWSLQPFAIAWPTPSKLLSLCTTEAQAS